MCANTCGVWRASNVCAFPANWRIEWFVHASTHTYARTCESKEENENGNGKGCLPSSRRQTQKGGEQNFVTLLSQTSLTLYTLFISCTAALVLRYDSLFLLFKIGKTLSPPWLYFTRKQSRIIKRIYRQLGFKLYMFPKSTGSLKKFFC